MKNNLILLSLLVFLAGFTTCTKDEDLTKPDTLMPEAVKVDAMGNKSQLNKLVAQVRQATAKYHNYQTALNDGFFNTQDCVSLPGVGGMGVHFVRFDRVDGIHNPIEPEVLVYEIKNNGDYKLVAIEYLAVGDTPPMFGGKIMFHPFSQPTADYELHLWAWKVNPAGMFEDWNPNVICP